MASKVVMAAVMARIAANWTSLPVVGPNDKASPPVDGFLDVEFPVATETQLTIGSPGSNVFREEGAFRLVMSIPVGVGLSPFDDQFEALRILFRSQIFDGVLTWGASPATIDDRNDQGSYFKLSCAIPYQFDSLG